MEHKRRFSLSNFHDLMYAITGAAIFVAVILTIVSVLQLCSSECAEGHKYRLFGLPFEVFGALFFATIAVMHILQWKNSSLMFYELLLFASALGAEMMFIIVQKYMIGAWCPVCLGIAACVAVGAGAQAASLTKTLQTPDTNGHKGDRMNFMRKGISSATAVFFGFLIAFVGITKYDAIEAAQETVQNGLAFGNLDSNIEVYLFTDWACPACRKLEPDLKKITDSITPQAKLIFVDHVVHPETLNFVPFHLSFILKNKDQYFKLRDMLTEISEETGSPSEDQIAAAAAKLGVKYDELNYADVAFAIKYYKQLGEKFKIEGTPTMVIINTDTKKGKKLAGLKEITQKNAQDAIVTLKK